MEDIWDLLASTNSAESIDDLERAFQNSVSQLDMDRYIYIHTSPLASTNPSCGNYPSEWISHYIENDYHLVDPTAYCCAALKRPFIWKDCKKVIEPSAKAIQFWQEAKEYGLIKGIGVPAQSFDQSIAGWGLALPNNVDEEKWLAQFGSKLFAFTNTFHYRFEQLIKNNNHSRKAFQLSNREAECIKWLCAGKTYWEIGKILSISDRTARFHISNARQKLRVNTNSQLISKSILYNIVSL